MEVDTKITKARFLRLHRPFSLNAFPASRTMNLFVTSVTNLFVTSVTNRVTSSSVIAMSRVHFDHLPLVLTKMNTASREENADI